MLATQEQMDFINKNFLIHRKTLTLCITSRCQFKCEHCCQEAKFDNYENMPKSLILEVCKQMKGWFLEIMGGEPFLEPELLKFAMKCGKENGAIIALTTTGYWIEDEELCDIARQADYIILPIDPWHRKEGITHELIDKVCDKFTHEKVKILCNFLTNTLDESMPKSNIKGSRYPLIITGRGNNLSRYTRKEEDNVTFCHSCGFHISPKGEINASCEANTNSCYIGNIKNYNDLNLLLKQCKRPAFIIDKNIPTCWTICQEVNNTIMDKSWNKILFKKVSNGKVISHVEKTEANIKKYRIPKELLC